MGEKEKKSRFFYRRDVTILGKTVYNTVYRSKIPILIVKELYLKKNLVRYILILILVKLQLFRFVRWIKEILNELESRIEIKTRRRQSFCHPFQR